MIAAALSIIWQIATSRLGIAVIIGALAYGYGYQRGHDSADRSAEITALESQVAIKEADLTAARAAERIARDQADVLASKTIQQQEYLNDLESDLAARPDRAVCRLSDADRRRLLDVDAGEDGGASQLAPLPILPPARHGAGAASR